MEKREEAIQGHQGVNPQNTAPDEITQASSRDWDETYKVFKQQDGVEIDAREAQRVLRKIDWHIMPLLMGSYMLQYLDKSCINFASVYGLQQGTNLHDQQYSWLTSIFYFGTVSLRRTMQRPRSCRLKHSC